MEDWRHLSNRFVAAKESQRAVLELSDRYRKLSLAERAIVDGLLNDALVSGEEWQRFDALAPVNEFRIVAALPALERLAAQLGGSERPGAPFELNKVRRLVARLSEES